MRAKRESNPEAVMLPIPLLLNEDVLHRSITLLRVLASVVRALIGGGW